MAPPTRELETARAELAEAKQQQAAMREVLRIISTSAADVQPVFQAIVESAARLCGAEFCFLDRFDGQLLHYVAGFGLTPEAVEAINQTFPMPPGPGSTAARAIASKAVVQLPDLRTAPAGYSGQSIVKALKLQSALAVPMLKDGVPIGVITLDRSEAGYFPEHQVELLKTFAEQAVIAIENARLFEEVEVHRCEAVEALEQQTATSEVLRVIAASPTDIKPVLDSVVASAVKICDAYDAIIALVEGDSLVISAHFGPIPVDFSASPLARDWVAGRSVLDRTTVHVADLTEAGDEFAQGRAMALRLGHRTILATPLIRKGEAIGTLILRRSQVRPFSDKQVELLKTFADQAVIAIGNARLFEEVEARNREVTEALEQQTATGAILRVIAASPTDIQPVLQVVAESAAQFCDTHDAVIFLRQGEILAMKAHHGPISTDFAPLPIGRDWVPGRAVVDGKMQHVHDLLASGDEFPLSPLVSQRLGFRTTAATPLMRKDEAIGALVIRRTEVRPFSDKQINLLKTFADQAVIAIENVRLFEEVQARTAELSEALQQQTATADVLKAISRSTFDLQPVLDTLAESAAKLCDADTSVIFKRDGDLYRWSANYGNPPAVEAFAKANPFAAGRDSVTGRVALEARAVHVSDVLADAEYGATQLQKLGGYRTILCVPILREGAPVGVFALTRAEVRDFTARQIELVETFADQSGIAIENVRLFDEVQSRTRELSRSLKDLRTAQDRLIQTEKLASLGQLTAGIAHEIKNPLNFVNNFSAMSGELINDLQSVLAEAPLDTAVREEVTELTGMLKGNLDKVVQHGKRADTIVRNMLLHSRAGSGEHRPVDINAVVEESLNLAYHGARAEKQGFNIRLERNFDPLAGEVDLYPQEITRVLLNLISNGFYATVKRGAEANGAAYEPVLAASTKNLGDSVEIKIRDNGCGISPDVKAKIFNPFFTTKPAGEGTGLGLSISHDIVVKQHAGTIEVDTEPGEFTEFTIVLRRGAAATASNGGRS